MKTPLPQPVPPLAPGRAWSPLQGTVPAITRGAPRGPHLVVVEESSSFPFALPARGEVVIGRGPEAGLSLSEPAASRRHASLSVDGSEVRITDLGSRNGTLVNGQPWTGERPLFAGDSVTIGTATLILYLPPSANFTAAGTDVRTLHRRLAEEVERARLYERSISVVVLLLDGQVDREAVSRHLDTELRLIDLWGWPSPGELVVVMPELGSAEAEVAVSRMLGGLRSVAVAARAGLAVYPHTACEPDALVAAARAGARGAAQGVVSDPDTGSRVEIGERAIVVADPAMVGLYDLIRRLAPTDLPVLVQGETGVGKENAAHALHAWSRRAAGPFVAVNCAAFPENLVESELFGSEKGAFSGAVVARPGLLESAHGGTLFFDEIGELPRALQPKLLRVLETKRATRVGGTRERELDVRVVAATNRDLTAEAQTGHFRQDLLFRLNAATVVLPPLRNRPREISVLARTFLAEVCKRLGLPPRTLAAQTMHLLTRHAWTGNVRELKNVIEYLAATATGPVIEPGALRARLAVADPAPVAPGGSAAAPATSAPAEAAPAVRRDTRSYTAGFSNIADEIRDLERRRMVEALEATGWVQTRAAELIGMPLRTFQQRAKVHALGRRRSPSGEADAAGDDHAANGAEDD
jgi:two-component system response regulator AtoC